MPWLHLVFDAWADYKQTRKQEREAKELAERGVETEEPGDAIDHAHGDKGKKKKRKKRKHKK